MSDITLDEIFERFDYDASTGVLLWKWSELRFFHNARAQKIWNTKHAGNVAGTQRRDGRLVISIRGKKLFAHRIAYAIAHGHWPSQETDHINGNNSDNRISNLRDVSKSQNMRNQTRRVDNTSGVTGVRVQQGNWMAYIQSKGRVSHLGSFGCKTAAQIARKSAEKALGYHENHGREA